MNNKKYLLKSWGVGIMNAELEGEKVHAPQSFDMVKKATKGKWGKGSRATVIRRG